MKALAPPSSATTHIQNTAPKPPRQMAVDTPTILPVPTRDAVDGLAKQAELDQTGADREIQARDDQKQRHDVRLI